MRVEEKFEKLVNGELQEQIQDAQDFARLNEINFDGNVSRINLTMNETKERVQILDRLKGKDIQYISNLDLNKLLRIRDNLQKTYNILELKQSIVEQIKDVKNRLKVDENKKTTLEQAKIRKIELEKEKEEIATRWSELDKQIVKAKNNPEEREKLVQEQEELKAKFSKNEEEININRETIENNNNIIIDDVKKAELEEESFVLGRYISMCNEACRQLMNGENIESIEVDRNIKEQVFKGKGQMKKIKEASKNKEKTETIVKDLKNKTLIDNEEIIDGLEEKIIETAKKGIGVKQKKEKIDFDEIEVIDLDKELEEEEQALVEKTSFAEKHPRLAKMINWVKNFFKPKESIEENIEEYKEEIETKNNEEQTKDEKIEEEKSVQARRDEEFRQYLIAVAQKGREQTNRDIEQYRKEELKRRREEELKNMKKAAMERQDEKFKNEQRRYSEKSGDSDGFEIGD